MNYLKPIFILILTSCIGLGLASIYGNSFNNTNTNNNQVTQTPIDTSKPTGLLWLTATPNYKNATYNMAEITILNVPISGIKANSLNLVSNAGGTINSLSLINPNTITFNYTTPMFADGDTLTLNGTNNDGTPFSLDIDTDILADF